MRFGDSILKFTEGISMIVHVLNFFRPNLLDYIEVTDFQDNETSVVTGRRGLKVNWWNRCSKKHFEFQICFLMSRILPAQIFMHIFFVLVAQEIKAQIQIQFNPVVMEILTVLSRMLSSKDKQRLVATYVWSEDDELTKYMRKQDSVFLAGLLVKEIQLTGREVVFGKLLQENKISNLLTSP